MSLQHRSAVGLAAGISTHPNPGWLSPVSVLWPVLLLTLAAALLAALALWLRRRRWLRAIVAAAGAVLLALGGAAAIANIRFDYYRTWGDLLLGPHGRDITAKSVGLDQIVALGPGPVTPPGATPPATPSVSPKARRVVADAVRNNHGLLIQTNIPGPRAGIATRGAWLYLPAAYFTSGSATSFPVLELFHGVPGGPRTWLTVLHVQDDLDQLIAAGQMPPSIVVMPTDNPSRFRSQECQDGPLARDETYLSDDVRAWVARSVPRASTGRWGVGGYSTGAYCAFLLMLHRPQDYAAAAGVDGYYHAIDTLFARGLYANEAQRLADSPDWLWQHAPPSLPVSFLVMQGTRDEDYGHARAFRRELVSSASKNLTLVSIDNPGAEHTATSWRTFDPVMVAWLARTLSAQADVRHAPRYPPLPLGPLRVDPLSTGVDVLTSTGPSAAVPSAVHRPPRCAAVTGHRPRRGAGRAAAPTPSATPAPPTPSASSTRPPGRPVACGSTRHPPRRGARGRRP